MKWWGSYTENEHVNVNGEVFGGWVLRTKSQLGAGNFVVHFLQNISKLKTIIYIYMHRTTQLLCCNCLNHPFFKTQLLIC